MPDDDVLLWKGDFSADERRAMARSGAAMADGSYPIPDADHLGKAIHAVGRGSNNSHDAIRKHIIARAKALGLSSQIPDTWGADGSVKKSEPVEKSAPLWTDDSKHIVYGVVMSPGVEDSQGDIVSADEIEKAAHKWLVEYRKQDVQHSEQPAPIEPVESFIAPQDLEIAGERVLKGAWVLGSRVNDSETWDRVSKADHPNPLTGYSIGGSGVREAIADAA